MSTREQNPFPLGDPDRREIWEMLVARDIDAFLACDWAMVEEDFAVDQFVGYSGPANPDHWRISYPTLAAYRDQWLGHAANFRDVALQSIAVGDFLHQTTVLRDIEIVGDKAMAHKKFDGRAATTTGEPLILNWQTLYWLRRYSSGWKITGFLGYLPNPMPLSATEKPPTITIPTGSTQHVTAGPYSPVLQVTGSKLVAVSGQGPIGPNGHIIGQTIEEQTEFTIVNCKRQLASAGVGFHDVFKVVVYLSEIAEWDAFNVVYCRHFTHPFPVRTAIQAVLWGGIKVEIDMLAISR
jgi:enamine deaminase RidA (YjgF/YER057c/UK114 family)